MHNGSLTQSARCVNGFKEIVTLRPSSEIYWDADAGDWLPKPSPFQFVFAKDGTLAAVTIRGRNPTTVYAPYC